MNVALVAGVAAGVSVMDGPFCVCRVLLRKKGPRRTAAVSYGDVVEEEPPGPWNIEVGKNVPLG
jgi:hypothetical protein